MRRQTHSPLPTLALVVAAAVAASGAATPAASQAQYANRDTIAVAQLTALASADAAPAAFKPTWRGPVGSPAAGEVTLSLERIGTPDDALDPVWPVLVKWAYQSSNDPGKSFVAEMFGRGTSDGRMDVTGVITSGYRTGSEVQLSMRSGKNGKAVLTIYPLRAK